MSHILSFDVENWFDGNLHRQWTVRPDFTDNRVENELARVLELLDEAGTKATFFMLGSLVDSHPHLVRAVAAHGHEVACHAQEHLLLRESNRSRYLAGLRRARTRLQDLSGQSVAGHRAPSWSLDRGVPWAPEVILAAGFTYDSSIFPMRTPLYGEPSLPATPFWLTTPTGGRLLELPPAVWRYGPVSLPFGGGIYWRLLPLWLVLRLLRQAKTPQVTYLHPWELNQAAIALPPELPWLPRLALRHGVAGAEARLIKLLRAVPFVPFRAVLPTWQTQPDLPILALAGER